MGLSCKSLLILIFLYFKMSNFAPSSEKEHSPLKIGLIIVWNYMILWIICHITGERLMVFQKIIVYNFYKLLFLAKLISIIAYSIIAVFRFNRTRLSQIKGLYFALKLKIFDIQGVWMFDWQFRIFKLLLNCSSLTVHIAIVKNEIVSLKYSSLYNRNDEI